MNKRCETCPRTSSSKWRGNTCNTCYASKWRNTEAGKENTKKLVERRSKDPLWKAYMQAYGTGRPKKPNQHTRPTNRFSALKTKARMKGWECDLEKAEYLSLISKSCFYCGGKLQKSGVGLDRTDTTRGYVKDNVVPCCYTCNRFKSNLLSKEETIQLIQVIRNMRSGKLWE